MHTYIHADTYTDKQTDIQIYAHTCTYTPIRTHTQIHKYIQMHVHTHIPRHPHIYIQTHTYVEECPHPLTHTLMYTFTNKAGMGVITRYQCRHILSLTSVQRHRPRRSHMARSEAVHVDGAQVDASSDSFAAVPGGSPVEAHPMFHLPFFTAERLSNALSLADSCRARSESVHVDGARVCATMSRTAFGRQSVVMLVHSALQPHVNDGERVR